MGRVYEGGGERADISWGYWSSLQLERGIGSRLDFSGILVTIPRFNFLISSSMRLKSALDTRCKLP